MAMTSLRWVGVVRFWRRSSRRMRKAWPVLVPICAASSDGRLGFTVFNALIYAAAYHTTAVNIAIFQARSRSSC